MFLDDETSMNLGCQNTEEDQVGSPLPKNSAEPTPKTYCLVKQRKQRLAEQNQRIKRRQSLRQSQNFEISSAEHTPCKVYKKAYSSNNSSRQSPASCSPEKNKVVDSSEDDEKSITAPMVFDPFDEPVVLSELSINLDNRKVFVNKPWQKGSTMQSVVIRTKSRGSTYPTYRLYVTEHYQFLMAARKRAKQTSSNFFITTDTELVVDRNSEYYVGKLRANFLGSEFTLYDNGFNAKHNKKVSEEKYRKELGAIIYQKNMEHSRHPRKINCVLPKLDEDGRAKVFQPPLTKGLIESYKVGQLQQIDIYKNQSPRWSKSAGAYILNFKGRVTEPSVKNFQMVSINSDSEVILQFGRIGLNQFILDFQYPFTPLQAFAICLSSFDYKKRFE